MLLMWKKEMLWELFAGFFLILILSDSRQPGLAFAGQVKEVYIVLLTVFVLLNSRKFDLTTTFIKPFIPFFAIAVVCIFFSERIVFVSIQKTLSYFLIMFIVPVYLNEIFRREGTAELKRLIMFGSFLLLLGLIMKLVRPELVHMDGRFLSIFGNPNGLGIFLLLFFILFSVVQHYYPHLLNRREKFLVYGVIFISLLLCQGRSSLIGVLIFLSFNYFHRLSGFLGFIVFLVIVFTYQIISANVEAIILTLGMQEYFRLDTLDSGSGRVIAWAFAWEEIQKNFFLGKGFGYTEYLYKQYYRYLSRLGHQGNAHNSYLTFWLETGLIGLVLYLRGLLLIFLKAARNTPLTLPILYSVAFSCFFESWLTASLNPFTIQLLIILTIIYGAQFKQKAAEEDEEQQLQLQQEEGNVPAIPVA